MRTGVHRALSQWATGTYQLLANKWVLRSKLCFPEINLVTINKAVWKGVREGVKKVNKRLML